MPARMERKLKKTSLSTKPLKLLMTLLVKTRRARPLTTIMTVIMKMILTVNLMVSTVPWATILRRRKPKTQPHIAFQSQDRSPLKFLPLSPATNPRTNLIMKTSPTVFL
jgi:hypothetical protein